MTTKFRRPILAHQYYFSSGKMSFIASLKLYIDTGIIGRAEMKRIYRYMYASFEGQNIMLLLVFFVFFFCAKHAGINFRDEIYMKIMQIQHA